VCEAPIVENRSVKSSIGTQTSRPVILTTINNNSKVGTILLLSLFDGDKLLELPAIYTQKHFYIKKRSSNSVEVKINETVLDKPETEYIVTKKKLLDSLSSINFFPVEITPFKDLYLPKFPLNNEEKNLSFLNNVYVFVKW